MMPVLAALWQWRRAILWGAVVSAIALMGWRVSAWREAYKAYPALEQRLTAEVECTAGSQCSVRQAALQAEQAAKSAEVVAEYEQELADLRNRPVERRVIRVCPDPGDVQGAGAAGRARPGAAAGGVVHGSTEFDTAPLREIARRADELSAQCRALIRWNEALSAD